MRMFTLKKYNATIQSSIESRGLQITTVLFQKDRVIVLAKEAR